MRFGYALGAAWPLAIRMSRAAGGSYAVAQVCGVAERYHVSVYDAMIVASAREARCKMLYTEDLQDGMTMFGVTIRNPFLS